MTQFKTFTDAERAALKLHGLVTDRPSQLSDAFVIGWRYGRNALVRELDEAVQPMPDGGAGYMAAFYEMAATLGVDVAQAKSPQHVYTEQVKPAVEKLIANRCDLIDWSDK